MAEKAIALVKLKEFPLKSLSSFKDLLFETNWVICLGKLLLGEWYTTTRFIQVTVPNCYVGQKEREGSRYLFASNEV